MIDARDIEKGLSNLPEGWVVLLQTKIEKVLEEVRKLIRSGVPKEEIEKRLKIKLDLKQRKVLLFLDS